MNNHFHVAGCGCFGGGKVSRRQLLKGGTVALATAVAPKAFGQELWNGNLTDSCSFYPEDELAGDIYTFASNGEAVEVVRKLTSAVGLRPNFEVKQANVPNAAAVIKEARRYILYSQVFIDEINAQTSSQWSSWTILAHEIGHHLNGHTLDSVGSRPDKELEADWFAGHAVAKIGGTLEQAKAPFATMSAEGSETHPGRAARLEAVSGGWHEGKGATPPDPDPTPQPVPVPEPEPEPEPVVVGNIDPPSEVVASLFETIGAGLPPSVAVTPEMNSVYYSQLDTAQFFVSSKGQMHSVQIDNQAAGPPGVTIYYFTANFDFGVLRGYIGLFESGMVHGLFFQ